MAKHEPEPDEIWKTKTKGIRVKVIGTGFLRFGFGRAAKTRAVIYQSEHDGEMTARAKLEFLGMFEKETK